MKNFFTCLLLVFMLSGCSISVHYVRKGKIDVPQKDHYTVTYKANFSEGLNAKIRYTDEQGNIQKLKDISGHWEKTVILKSGENVHVSIITSGEKSKADYKVLVDDEVISEHILTGKKLKYNFGFVLP
jgi:uncharacterized protein YqfA (UPF0365 family)